jgi:hypothetical protein
MIHSRAVVQAFATNSLHACAEMLIWVSR